MCLRKVYRGKKKQEILDSLPESMYVWKNVRSRGRRYYPEFNHVLTPFKSGWNKAIIPRHRSMLGYQRGFHFWHRKTGVKRWCTGETIIRCRIEKKDIVALGEQGVGFENELVIVAKRGWFPKYKAS